jgi:hypothetical protein
MPWPEQLGDGHGFSMHAMPLNPLKHLQIPLWHMPLLLQFWWHTRLPQSRPP